MLVTVAGLVPPGVLRGQERPLRTEDPAPIPAGAILLLVLFGTAFNNESTRALRMLSEIVEAERSGFE